MLRRSLYTDLPIITFSLIWIVIEGSIATKYFSAFLRILHYFYIEREHLLTLRNYSVPMTFIQPMTCISLFLWMNTFSIFFCPSTLPRYFAKLFFLFLWLILFLIMAISRPGFVTFMWIQVHGESRGGCLMCKGWSCRQLSSRHQCWEPNSGSLPEQHMLLTAVLVLQHLVFNL